MSEPPTAVELDASAEDGPVRLEYLSGGVRRTWAGDRLDVFVPADRHALAARRMLVGMTLFGVMFFPLWKIWSPAVLAVIDGMSVDGLIVLGGTRLMATAFLGSGFTWLVLIASRRAHRPMAITAGPDGCRYEAIGGRRAAAFLPRGQVTRVFCRPMFGGRHAAVEVFGHFSRRWPFRLARRVAVGTLADMAELAADLRTAMGLPAEAT